MKWFYWIPGIFSFITVAASILAFYVYENDSRMEPVLVALNSAGKNTEITFQAPVSGDVTVSVQNLITANVDYWSCVWGASVEPEKCSQVQSTASVAWELFDGNRSRRIQKGRSTGSNRMFFWGGNDFGSFVTDLYVKKNTQYLLIVQSAGPKEMYKELRPKVRIEQQKPKSSYSKDSYITFIMFLFIAVCSLIFAGIAFLWAKNRSDTFIQKDMPPWG